jgi:hypothetical protein
VTIRNSRHRAVGCDDITLPSARRFKNLLGVVALILLHTPVASATAGRDEAAGLPAFDVPGGTSAFAEVLGIRPSIPRSRILLAAIRVLWEAPEGADPVAGRRRARALDYLRTLAASERSRKRSAERGSADAAREMVPAYLPHRTWESVALDHEEFAGSWFTAILGNRRLALFYYGLASIDRQTLAYLGARPDLLRDIAEHRSHLFATFGRSLRVRDGRMQVPGGPDAVASWEAVAGERVTKPVEFMGEVLGRDGGRLALLYDGLAHLEPAALRFAVGLAMPAGERVERFRKFYDEAGAVLGRWEPADRPFERVPFDAIHILLAARFEADGRAPGPAWRNLWKLVFDPTLRIEDREAIASAAVFTKSGDRMDAADLIGLVAVGDADVRRQRCAVWLFASRVFRQPSRNSAQDLLVVLKAFPRFETLLLTLERMGITAVPTYLAAVRTASSLADADRRLWQFQAALAILERSRSSRSIDVPAADALVRSLCAATPEGGDGYRGAIARWLERDFLAAVPASILPPGLETGDRPLETRVLAAMSGAVSSAANQALRALPAVEWEGLRYHFDPAGSTLRRLALVRTRQGGPSLDAALALARLGDALSSASSSVNARAALGGVTEIVATLRRQAGDAPPSLLPGGEPKLDDLVREANQRAGKLKSPPDAKARQRLSRPLLEASDWYLAEVLGAIAYAPHLGDPAGPALLGGDPSRVHDFRFFKTVEGSGRSAWQWPIETRGSAGWRVTGSLLGLDLALGRLALRRVPRETIPEAPRLSDAMRAAFVEGALLMVSFDLTESAAQALRDAIARGRQRVAALEAGTSGTDDVARDADLDEWRTEALRWTAGREPAGGLELFSLAELARLGGLDPDRVAGLDAWGTSAWSRDGALATSYPARLPWTTLAGRRVVRGVPALVPDLAIGIVQSLAPLRLHAQVAAGVLLYATQDYVDTLRTAHEDDWQEMVAHAQALAAGPIDDFVAGLTITGPLVPDQTETRREGRPDRR